MVNLSLATMDKGSKDAFVAFIKEAVSDPNSPAKKEVYHFLVKCFLDADADMDGAVNPVEFDQMIEEAASAPRRYGLAPSTISLYATPEGRLDARKTQFAKMDSNNDGKISLDEWLDYCLNHIIEKAAKI